MNTNDIYELHKKAENGDINAQKELADLYIDAPSRFLHVMNGNFMAIDPIKTAYWLRKAAALGDAEAQYRIGVCYEEGEGVLTQDVYAAVNYFIAAAKQGYSPARSALFERYPNALMDPDNVLFNIPASDISWSLSPVGILTINGTGVMPDFTSKYTQWQCRKEITAVIIIRGVTSIGDLAFETCSGLISISIPDSVTRIGEGVFGGCKKLTSITIPESVSEIGERAFRGCINLTSITIPLLVSEIKDCTFAACTNLTSISIIGSVSKIGERAFEDCSALTEIINWSATPANISDTAFMNVDKAQCVLRVPACSVETYRTIDGWKDFKNIESII